ncbi:short subunit dehydrogenase [Novosphingobium taihuense]|uniref:NAD(P)-dependent dehydrogenase (Short-subunit alcohol dehydrogenase family) n=1 Tax=Novosphingobium taihuense TaxID=260085 RepID=A0A7W7AD80_9SPHN|nr:NAD(P)-dependent dehydrogenase (short-subunit alcohol dehydrogenase family) [Novosphingobium taihuense]TWH86935.1 short subunit dehydrogenase [Novosphingobium taihuense]
MANLAGKVALVTGGGQGVGQGIALALASEGVAVTITGRTLAKVEETARLITERGGKALPLVGNVKDAADLAAMVDQTVTTFGGLDILVNNAQEVPLGKLEDVTDEAFMAGFESGPLATRRLMKLARPHMAARGGGTIFNLCSSAGIRWDMAGYGAYAAVKQAIRSLTRAAAAE